MQKVLLETRQTKPTGPDELARWVHSETSLAVIDARLDAMQPVESGGGTTKRRPRGQGANEQLDPQRLSAPQMVSASHDLAQRLQLNRHVRPQDHRGELLRTRSDDEPGPDAESTPVKTRTPQRTPQSRDKGDGARLSAYGQRKAQWGEKDARWGKWTPEDVKQAANLSKVPAGVKYFNEYYDD